MPFVWMSFHFSVLFAVISRVARGHDLWGNGGAQFRLFACVTRYWSVIAGFSFYMRKVLKSQIALNKSALNSQNVEELSPKSSQERFPKLSKNNFFIFLSENVECLQYARKAFSHSSLGWFYCRIHIERILTEMINRLQMNHKVANTQQLLPTSTSTRQKMNYRAPQHPAKSEGEEDRVTLKHDDSDSVKGSAKMKRTFKSSVMRSLRSDRVLLPKSLQEMTIETDTNAKKSTADRAAQYMRPLRCNCGNQRCVSQAWKNVDQKNKRIRRRNVIGSLRSILGPEDGYGKSNLPKDQPDTGLASEKIASPEKSDGLERPKDLQKETTISVSKPSSFSKRWESRRLKSMNQKQESSALPNSLVQSQSKRKPTSAAVHPASAFGTIPTTLSTRKGRDVNPGSGLLSMKSETEKDEKQTVKEKVRVMRNPKSRQFDEVKLREEIRSRLQKNLEKYEALMATLDSSEGNAASDQTSSTLSRPATMSQEGKKALVTKSHATPTVSTKAGRQSRVKSKTKMARSHSVRNRIPLTIQEDSILGESRNSQSTRRVPPRERRSSQVRKKTSMKAKVPQSPKKAKASFYPRSPKNSPGRNRRRFRVAVPHPTECAGSRVTNHGGLCMTFPARTQNGERIEEKERRISVERIQGLMLIQ